MWSANAGTVNPSGLFTAPASTGTITVVATSTQNTSISGQATILVQGAAPPPTVTSVAITCNPAAIAPNATSRCTATVQGTGSYSSAVMWSANAGTVNPSGLFTAPATAGSVTVTATSTQNTAIFGQATILVEPPAPPPTVTSVSVSCSPITIAPNATSQCTATVQGTGGYSSAVTWSASAGKVSSSGLVTATASTGGITITATSTQNAAISGQATIMVQLQVPESKHIVMVMEENQSYSTVVANTTSWPHLNALIGQGALPTHFYADTHPSIGNYLMLTTGQILTNDDGSTTVWNVDNIARRMLAANAPFRVYAEGIPQPGYLGGDTGLYAIRHNPFALLSDVADNPQVADEVIWPFSQFAIDAANNALPKFSFVVPDLNDDAHNGTPQQADDWLQASIVEPLSGYSAFQPGGDGLLIVDFDEADGSDTSYGGGHVSPAFWGPLVQVGYTQSSTTIYQHESMLRTVIEALRLQNPPGAAAGAPDMAEFFVQK